MRRLVLFGSGARSGSPRDLDFLVDLGDRPPADYAAAYFALRSTVERRFGIIGEALSRLAKDDPGVAAAIPNHGKPPADFSKKKHPGRLTEIVSQTKHGVMPG